MRLLSGIILGVLIILLGLAVVVATGSVNFAAVASPTKFETQVATFALGRSIAKHAAATKNPVAGSPDALRVGLAHYKENCVLCHGAPGVEETEAGMGLNPPAPDLTLPAIQKMSDGELYWVIANGVRWTGMPAFSLTHKPDELWKVVAFVRHLPELNDQEQKALKAGSEEEAGHHEGQAADESKTPVQ